MTTGNSCPSQQQYSRSPLEEAFWAYLGERSSGSLEQVMVEGSGLVHHFARLFTGGRASEDLAQAGYEGLMKAALRFDTRRGVRFSTYASHCVMGEIRREITREKAHSRPVWALQLQERVLRATEELVKRNNGQAPTLAELSPEANISQDGIREVMRAGTVPFEELDLTVVKSARYEHFQLPLEDRIAIRQALGEISRLQRRAIYLVFYLDLTQSQAARRMGTTQRRVSRLLRRGLRQLAGLLSRSFI